MEHTIIFRDVSLREIDLEPPSRHYTPPYLQSRPAQESSIRERYRGTAPTPQQVIEALNTLVTEHAPEQHPCYAMVRFLMGETLNPGSAMFYDHWRGLVLEAIEMCVHAAQSTDGED